MPKIQESYSGFLDLFNKSTDASELNRLCESIKNEENSFDIDYDLIKKNQDWNILAYQVVGYENK